MTPAQWWYHYVIDIVKRLAQWGLIQGVRKQTALALLLDVKGAFDRVNKGQLLRQIVQVGIVGNIIHWVNLFLSYRRAVLVVDGRTGESHDIQTGLPQGSPVLPVLFILSFSSMFQWLEERHAKLSRLWMI
jgi:hypothetical protein